MSTQKRKKYKFHTELKKYSKINVPIIPALLPMLQVVLRLLTFGEHSGPFVQVHHGKICGKDGKRIRTVIYTSRKFKRGGPCILVYHGGGFIYPASLHHYVLARKLAKETKGKAILVDYRLAPKYKFPSAAADAISAYQWVLANAKKLGIDEKKIAVCGDSAGGNLSAVVSLWARNEGIRKPCGQVLIYPVLDARMKTKSMKMFTDSPMCNTRAMEKYFHLYLSNGAAEHSGQEPLCDQEILREYLSPAETASFEGMPPTFMEVAQYDCLRDEGLAFARKLKRAGIETEVYKIKGAMHGYDIATGTRLVKRCMEQRIAFLNHLFGTDGIALDGDDV